MQRMSSSIPIKYSPVGVAVWTFHLCLAQVVLLCWLTTAYRLLTGAAGLHARGCHYCYRCCELAAGCIPAHRAGCLTLILQNGYWIDDTGALVSAYSAATYIHTAQRSAT